MNTRQFIYLLFIAELILSGFWYAGSAVTAMFLIASGVAGCSVMLARQSCQVYALSKLMLLYLLWLFVVAWLSAVPATAMINLAILSGLPVMYLFATNTPGFAQTWTYLRIGLCVMGVVLALWASAQVFYHVGYGYAQGPFQDRNLFAALMNLLWFPAAFVFFSAHKAHKHRFDFKLIAAAIGLFIISMGLFATTSRGGIATWCLLLPVLLWAAYRHQASWRRIAWVVVIAASAYLCSALLLNASIAERTFALDQDPSTTARLQLWQSSIQMLLAHPGIGSGWGTFIHYYPAYRIPQEYTTAGMMAHNDYLQLAAEGGIPALLLQLCILGGVLMQLKRSLALKAESKAFESVALLLGVLALFIHASVNFIFYQAIMNILAGVYLARAAQLIEKPDSLPVLLSHKINAFFRYLFAVAVLVPITLPYAAHLLGGVMNNQHHLKKEHLLSDEFSAYQLAKWVTIIQPQERVSQETLLQTAERALADQDFISKMGSDFYRQLLDATLQRYEVVRALNANDPDVGVRQAGMLIRHHAAFEPGNAYGNARQVLNASLKANSYHVDSIVALSRLQRLQGQAVQALHTIRHARTYVLRQPDKQLLYIELLRQHAAPATVPELEAIDEECRRIIKSNQAGKRMVLPEHYFETMDAKLEVIAKQTAQKRP